MEDLFSQLTSHTLAGNSALDWLLAGGVALVVSITLRLLVRLLHRQIATLSEKTTMVADDLVAAALASTKSITFIMAGIWAGARFLAVAGTAARILDIALLIAVVLQLAIWANRMVSAYIHHYTESYREENPAAVSVVQGASFLVRLAIWSIALLLVIDNFGYDVTALVAGLGISGIAIALAVQNILGDLFASLSIVLDKPFVIGDFIIVGELMGVVEKIGLKTTRVRSLSGEQLIFSNSDLLASRVRNFKRMQERRVPFGFGVLYQTTPEQLEAIPPMLKAIIDGIDNARFDRAHFKGFGDSSYDFEVVYYVGSADFNVYMDIQQTINLAICRGFAERGIEFAYPTRTIYVHGEEGPTGAAGGELSGT
jgi:small-conductance mechanosensitive channel